MASMIESLMGMLSGDALNKISEQSGAPSEKVQQALPDVMAVLTGALAKNSYDDQEASAISSALAKDHDGSILNNISNYVSNYQAANGDGILKHVLGNKRGEVEQVLSKKENLDASSISNLLKIAAPLIMGALGKQKQQQGLDASSLSNVLGKESSQAQSLFPNASDILGQILGGSARKQDAQQAQPQQQAAGGTPAKRSGFVTVIIVLAIAVVVYFVLRSCGML